MNDRRELALFAAVLAMLIAGFFHETLFGGKVLSPADALFTTVAFAEASGTTGDYEPANRLLMDPVIQFQPWLEFTRSEIRAGRLPLWNPYAGCGAPHLANGQSAVFDPFQVLAYVGTLPDALAWMAAGRLWVAGLGMFLLAGSWGFSRQGQWFSGLTYPFCGFLVGWLLYPVANVAIWMPWVVMATDRALSGPGLRGIPALAVAVGLTLLGGHVQTSSHVLLAAGCYALWQRWRVPASIAPLSRFAVGIALGVAIAAIEILPLAAYLTRSPAWSDRHDERPAILAISRPRVLDAATTALPYLFGSQRRGQPNLAKPLGVHNLNETAGGFVGLATLLWLAPSAWSARRQGDRVSFLTALAAFGVLGAFGVPPVVNLLRIFPVINVTDHRRLTLWIAFALCLLGGIGIDQIGISLRTRAGIWWTRTWLAAAMILAIAALGIFVAREPIREKARSHYLTMARETPGADPRLYEERAERQARQATTFLPAYDLLAAGHLGLLFALQRRARRERSSSLVTRIVFGLVLIDVLSFGYNLNPAIPRSKDRPQTELIAYLRREVPPPMRILGLGAELPPNTLMRYGLADVRNYDSVELSRSLSWFEPMYEPDPVRPIHTSRREVNWQGAIRARDHLRTARVGAIVAASPPPDGIFPRVDRVGGLWVARLDEPIAREIRPAPGEIRIDLREDTGQVRWIAETFDPGWNAEIDGNPVPTKTHQDTFLSVDVPQNASRLSFRYEPWEVRVGLMISVLAVLMTSVGAAWNRRKIRISILDRSGGSR